MYLTVKGIAIVLFVFTASFGLSTGLPANNRVKKSPINDTRYLPNENVDDEIPIIRPHRLNEVSEKMEPAKNSYLDPAVYSIRNVNEMTTHFDDTKEQPATVKDITAQVLNEMATTTASVKEITPERRNDVKDITAQVLNEMATTTASVKEITPERRDDITPKDNEMTTINSTPVEKSEPMVSAATSIAASVFTTEANSKDATDAIQKVTSDNKEDEVEANKSKVTRETAPSTSDDNALTTVQTMEMSHDDQHKMARNEMTSNLPGDESNEQQLITTEMSPKEIKAVMTEPTTKLPMMDKEQASTAAPTMAEESSKDTVTTMKNPATMMATEQMSDMAVDSAKELVTTAGLSAANSVVMATTEGDAKSVMPEDSIKESVTTADDAINSNDGNAKLDKESAAENSATPTPIVKNSTKAEEGTVFKANTMVIVKDPDNSIDIMADEPAMADDDSLIKEAEAIVKPKNEAKPTENDDVENSLARMPEASMNNIDVKADVTTIATAPMITPSERIIDSSIVNRDTIDAMTMKPQMINLVSTTSIATPKMAQKMVSTENTAAKLAAANNMSTTKGPMEEKLSAAKKDQENSGHNRMFSIFTIVLSFIFVKFVS